MSTPERSKAIARALAGEPEVLPEDFAAQVAALAAANSRAYRWNGTDVALAGAFVTMVCVCVAGWFTFAPHGTVFTEWLAPVVRDLASRPWLLIGAGCVILLEALTLVRRQRSIGE